MKTFNWGCLGSIVITGLLWVGIIYLVRWVLTAIFRNLAG